MDAAGWQCREEIDGIGSDWKREHSRSWVAFGPSGVVLEDLVEVEGRFETAKGGAGTVRGEEVG